MRRTFLQALLTLVAAPLVAADQFDSGSAFRNVPVGKLKRPDIMVPVFYHTMFDDLYFYADGAWKVIPAKESKENN